MNDVSENSPDEENNESRSLFRKEALEHKKTSYLGNVSIATPLSFSIWSIGILIIAVSILLFTHFGRYAKHRQARGILVPNKGLIHVYAKNPGIVADCLVKRGEHVIKDQIIYQVSTEQHSLENQGLTSQQVTSLEKQIAIQTNRLSIYQDLLKRYQTLLQDHFVSEVEYQRARDEYLHNEIILKDLEQKLIQAKSAVDYTVRAPASGTVSTMVAMVGDRVTADRPLASIIPDGAVLHGILFVNTKDIGFVKLGQKILLKYDAFPYQNFGLYESTVDTIDESVLSPKDLDLPMTPDLKTPGLIEPFYRVIVNLKSQYVVVYGKPHLLTAGMTLTGEIIGEKRRIWQWILDPIYTLKGSLVSS